MRGLYAITPETLDTNKLIEQVRQVIAGGATIVQYRCKRFSHEIQRMQAGALRAVTHGTGTHFIVNDNSELALSVGADGVHLGRDDGNALAISRIRNHWAMHNLASSSRPFMIGVSCYNELSRAADAVEAGADYIAFGSFFSSPTKPFAAKADLSLLHAARAQFDVPIVAIGGITVDNAKQLIATGVDMVAVITSLFDADDIEQRARKFADLFKPGNHVR